MMKKKNGFTVEELLPLSIAFVVVTIAIAMGANVLSQIQAGEVTGVAGCNATVTTGCGYSYNATDNGLASLDELSSWLPTIALIVAAAVIIGIIIVYLARRFA